jgi:hypothetical protein
MILTIHVGATTDIEIPRIGKDGAITAAFFDPTGRHLIVTTDIGENYYLYDKWQKCKLLKTLKVRDKGTDN